MTRLEEKINNENELAKIEMLDFAQDMKRYQKDVTDCGYPFWHKHPSKMLLRADVKANKGAKLVPKVLWKSRKEYQDFPLSVFRNHVYHEKRRLREKPYWQVKRNKKGLRKHEEKAGQLKKEWYQLKEKKKEELLAEMMGNLCL